MRLLGYDINISRAAKKTGSGKVKRYKAYKTHILSKMTRKRKRNLRKPTLVSDADMRKINLMMPY